MCAVFLSTIPLFNFQHSRLLLALCFNTLIFMFWQIHFFCFFPARLLPPKFTSIDFPPKRDIKQFTLIQLFAFCLCSALFAIIHKEKYLLQSYIFFMWHLCFLALNAYIYLNEEEISRETASPNLTWRGGSFTWHVRSRGCRRKFEYNKVEARYSYSA